MNFHSRSMLALASWQAWIFAACTMMLWPESVTDGQQNYRGVARYDFWPNGVGYAPQMEAIQDLDGDGVAEIVISDEGYRYLDTDPNVIPGKVAVISGATGDEIYNYVGELGTGGSGEELGFTAANLGDVDGDGVEDFSGGCVFGSARVWSGKNGRELFRSPGVVEVVAALGDVNGDGLPDFAFRDSSPPYGAIHVYAGGSYEVLYTVQPPFLVWLFAFRILSLGDVNADGCPDFAASAPDNPHSIIFKFCHFGHVFVFSGRDGSILYEIPGVAECDFFGYSLASPGDLNGDRVADLAIGIPGQSIRGVPIGGRVGLHDGKTGRSLAEIQGPNNQFSFAYAMAAVGDVNGNGFGDLLVHGTVFRGDPGAWLYDGGTRRLLYVVADPNPDPALGARGWAATLSGIPDERGDGFPDFAVGASGSAGSYLGDLAWFDSAPYGVRSFGMPCSQVGGVTPRIGITGEPRIGSEISLHLSEVQAGDKGLLLLGLSNAMWQGCDLPLDLGFAGIKGCDLLVSANVAFPAIASKTGGDSAAATVDLTLDLPRSMVGRAIYAQWIVRGRREDAASRALELLILP